MITTTGRFPEEPLPRLGSDGAEAPEFPVKFSRPTDLAGRSDTRPNTFRWTGTGTIRVMERGLMVMARRRSALGFYTTEQRLVPAWEIADVYREGNSVRLDLRGDARHRDFFQFWANDASMAGTIVRLLPTTRTIEFEGAHPTSGSTDVLAQRRRVRVDALIPIALAVVLGGIVALLAVPKLRDYISPPPPVPVRAVPTPNQTVSSATPGSPRRPTDAELMNARVALSVYDERIDGLRAQFRMAFTALQYGDLSRADFVDGVNRWLLPQWRDLYLELGSKAKRGDPLDSAVRARLMAAVLGWEGALHEYVRGLREDNSIAVLGAVDQMSAATDQQRQAWLLIDRAAR